MTRALSRTYVRTYALHMYVFLSVSTSVPTNGSDQTLERNTMMTSTAEKDSAASARVAIAMNLAILGRIIFFDPQFAKTNVG